MASFLNNDEAIWLKHVNADSNTIALLRQIPAGTRLELIVEGRRCDWQRMSDGKDGRPTLGLKPIGDTIDFWKTMKVRRGEYLEFKIADSRDTYLSAVAQTFNEWHSAEDEAAFNDL